MAHDELAAAAAPSIPLPVVATTRFRARATPHDSARNSAHGAAGKKRQGSGARLNDSTRLEIIALLNAPQPLSLRKIATQFGVVEATIRHVRDRASVIMSRALGVSEDVRQATRRVVQKTFPALETQLAAWLQTHGYDPCALDTSVHELVTRKAMDLAAHLDIASHDFSASKSWLRNFQRRCQATKCALTLDSELIEDAPIAPSATSTVLNKRKRGAGPRLSDSQRLEILALLRQHNAPSNRKLADMFSVDEATVRHIKANAVTIEQRARSLPIDVRQTTFRAGRTQFAELESIVAEWIDASRRCREEIPASVVRRRAEELAAELEFAPHAFKATVSWYASFCRRRGLGPVAPICDLEAIVANYAPANVYTVDETGLFYSLLPLRPVDAESALKRVTLVLCCNATGSERLPLTVVANEPEADTTLWPLPVITHPKAWVDAQVFSTWFDTVFVPYINKRQGQGDQFVTNSNTTPDILLLLDTAPGHPVSFTAGNIRVLALHAASASWTPPLEIGVMTALKSRYKRRVLCDMLAFDALPLYVQHALDAGAGSLDSKRTGLFFGHAPTLLDAVQRLADAWDDLSPELLKCAFETANFMPQFRTKYDNGLTAARVEAQELALERDMLGLLRQFHRRSQRATTSGSETCDGSDAALASALQSFLHVDDESSAVYHQCIVDEVDRAASSSSSSSSADWTDEAVSDGSTMHRILNGAVQPVADLTAAPATAPVVTEADVLAQATLLGLQLRQLQAARTDSSSALGIDSAVLALDTLRRELHAATASISSVDSSSSSSSSNR